MYGPAKALDNNATTYAMPGASSPATNPTYTTSDAAFATAMQVSQHLS